MAGTDKDWERVRDEIPESFWTASFWDTIGWRVGKLDVADRQRIGKRIIEEVTRAREQDAVGKSTDR